MPSWKPLLAIAILAFCACKSGRAQPGANPQLWYFHHSYLSNQSAVTSSEALIDQAAAARYSGMVLWDSGIGFLQDSSWNPSYMSQVIQYAQSKGLAVVPVVAPCGYEVLLPQSELGRG